MLAILGWFSTLAYADSSKDVATLVAIWDDIVLPRPVRSAWAAWLRDQRGITVSC